jgi:hypothetical protein
MPSQICIYVGRKVIILSWTEEKNILLKEQANECVFSTKENNHY